MAKSLEKKVANVEESSSKASINLHDINLQTDDSENHGKRISEVAYELFLKRGATHGNDLGDWYEAERIVLSELKS